MGVMVLTLATLIFADSAFSQYSQGKYRRPSESDIEWLLGNGKPNRPQRQTDCATENGDIVQVSCCKTVDQQNVCSAELKEPQTYRTNVSPCQSACKSTCSTSCNTLCNKTTCRELSNPVCSCRGCSSVGPCERVRSAPQTLPRSAPLPPSASPLPELVPENTSNLIHQRQTTSARGSILETEDMIVPVVGIPSDNIVQTSVQDLAEPASPEDFPKDKSLEEMVSAEEKVSVPTPISSKKTLADSAILPSKPKQEVKSENVTKPTPDSSQTVRQESRVLKSLGSPRAVQQPPMPKTCGPVKEISTCEPGCQSSCCRPAQERTAGFSGSTCASSFGRTGDCSCESCCGSPDEIVASTIIGDCLRKITCLHRSRTKHGSSCSCWLCGDLDNPDMIGDAGWLPKRFVGFYDRGSDSALYQSAPTIMMSRLNVAEHFNAEVRDRIWFDYRHMNNSVRLGQGTRSSRTYETGAVDQFTFGLEKKFFGCSSLELRVPLVNQYDSGFSLSEYGKSATEIGNISVVFKYLFTRNENFSFAGGIGMTFPTADDWKVEDYGASLENKAYTLVPYLGVQWHPNDSTFGHGLVQVDIPVSKNELHYQGDVAEVDDQTILRIGLQVGRWFYRNERGMHSCRLGGFLELDYSLALDNADNVMMIGYNRNGVLFYGANKQKPEALNLVAGVPILFGQLSLTNAVILPMTSNDRQFSVAYSFSASRRY